MSHKRKQLYLVIGAIGLFFLLRKAGGEPPPPAGFVLSSSPQGGTNFAPVHVSIFDAITFTITGTAGTPVSLLARKRGDNNYFDWKTKAIGVIAGDGTFTFTASVYEMFGFVYNGAPYVPVGEKYFIAVPYDYTGNTPPQNRSNEIVFSNLTRS